MHKILRDFEIETDLLIQVAESAGAVEYTDCTSADEEDLLPNECPGYDTKQ